LSFLDSCYEACYENYRLCVQYGQVIHFLTVGCGTGIPTQALILQ